MTPDALLALKLPDELPRVFAAIKDDLAADRSPAPLLRGLAVLNPLALVDVVIGPRAPGGAAMTTAALATIETLESVVPPSALYRRLVRQAGAARSTVLSTAVARHPEADWLVPLSRLAEGDQAGHTHLTADPERTPAALTALCAAHIAAGHRAGLITAGAALGRLEPTMALLSAGDLPHAAAGMLALLHEAPESGVVERIAARWSPDISPLLAAAIPHLTGRAEAEDLRRYTRWYPSIDRALDEHMARLSP